MRLALLAIDHDTLAIAKEIARHGEHQIAWYAADCDCAGEIASLAPTAPSGDDWESLLDGDVADAVVVGRSGNEDQRADQLRKLIQAGIPLVVHHPVHSSMLVCYELEMIRQTSGSLIQPYSVVRSSSAFERLFDEAIAKQALGTLEQLIVERSPADHSPEAVRRLFAEDMSAALALAGDLTRLSALAPTSEPAGYGNLGVQLSGPSNILVRWSVGPREPGAAARMTLVGSRGRAVWELPEHERWRLDLILPERSETATFAPADGAARTLDVFVRQAAAGAASADWSVACRAVELADSIQRSLEKGRTIELHSEDYSEENTFKGTMTSLGCGLLLVSLFVLIVGVVAAGFGIRIADFWPIALLGILGLFLLLQLLRFAFPTPPSGEPRGSTSR